MRLLRNVFFMLTFVGMCLPGYADSQQAMLQVTIDLGKRPVTRLMLAFRPELSAEMPAGHIPVSLPLYTHFSNAEHRPPVQAAEDSKTFCEKSRTGCIAFASLIGIGIFFVVTQYEHDPNDGRTTITVNTGQSSR